MQKSKLILYSFLHAAAVVAYVFGVVAFINNLESNFHHIEDERWAPVLFLLTFVVSATTCGLLVFGRPVYMFLNGQKSDAVKFLFNTVAWLIGLTVLVFVFFIT